MIPRPDLLDPRSPRGMEVFQLTREADVPSTHVYMEAQIFTPDSRRLVLHRSASPHGSDPRDPKHRYLLCDIESGGELTPLTDELGATAPSVSPDGQFLYYFLDHTEPGRGGRITLRRRNIDGSNPQPIVVIDGALPGSGFRPSRVYPLSTVSSDGKRIAVSAYLGDGRSTSSPFGLMVFDLAAATVRLVLSGPAWCNAHPQYSRSLDASQSRDLLVQENHGRRGDANGGTTLLVSGLGADIHVIRDDGMNFRDIPWGRDGVEQCQGHQCWRGRSDWAITTTITNPPGECRLIESRAVAHADHNGRLTEGAADRRNDLSRDIASPQFYHFATDSRGTRLIVDAEPGRPTGGAIYLAGLGAPGREPLRNLTYLLSPRSKWEKGAHMHPFLSPDGKTAFFNSDESGILQAYMIRGLPHVGGIAPEDAA